MERAPLRYKEYHPYGSIAWWLFDSSRGVSQTRYKYTGMERDEETRLQQHGVRYYAPWLGRWLTDDIAGVLDGVNRYAYCRLNPIRGSDRSGESTDDDVGVALDAIFEEQASQMCLPTTSDPLSSPADGRVKERDISPAEGFVGPVPLVDVGGSNAAGASATGSGVTGLGVAGVAAVGAAVGGLIAKPSGELTDLPDYDLNGGRYGRPGDEWDPSLRLWMPPLDVIPEAESEVQPIRASGQAKPGFPVRVATAADILADEKRGAGYVNLDTGSLIGLSVGGSAAREVESLVDGRKLLVSQSAYDEFTQILQDGDKAGPQEIARALSVLDEITVVPDILSPRFQAVRETGGIGRVDINVFGTGDALGVETLTGDAAALRALQQQGITDLWVGVHQKVSFLGR